LTDEPLAAVVRGVAAAGFSGILLDRYGFGAARIEPERAIAAAADADPWVSPNRRLVFFDLRGLATTLADSEKRGLRQAVLEPLRLEWGAGFYPEERDATGHWRWMQRPARLEIVNPSAGERVAIFHATVIGSPPGRLRVVWPGGEAEEFAAGATIDRRLRLAPGRNAVEWNAGFQRHEAPRDRRRLLAMLRSPALLDAAFESRPAREGHQGETEGERSAAP
jgi:hypothetical protein